MHKNYKKLDAATWGGYKISESLVKILNESEYQFHINKVGKIFSNFTALIKSLEPLKNKPEYDYFAFKVLNDFKSKIYSTRNFPEVIKSHLFNLIHAHYNVHTKNLIKVYRLKVTINKKGLLKNKIFDNFINEKGGIIFADNKEIKFNNTEYFELVYRDKSGNIYSL